MPARQGAEFGRRQASPAALPLGDHAVVSLAALRLVELPEPVLTALPRLSRSRPEAAEIPPGTALAVFAFSQRAADLWRGANNSIRREVRDSV